MGCQCGLSFCPPMACITALGCGVSHGSFSLLCPSSRWHAACTTSTRMCHTLTRSASLCCDVASYLHGNALLACILLGLPFSSLWHCAIDAAATASMHCLKPADSFLGACNVLFFTAANNVAFGASNLNLVSKHCYFQCDMRNPIKIRVL